MPTEQTQFKYWCQELFNEDLGFAGKLLQRAARLYGSRIALKCQDDVISFKDLYYRACQLSQTLKNKGVGPGDRVIILWHNSIEFYIGYFAAWQLGAVVVPLNIFLHQKELLHVVADAQPKAMVIHSSFIEQNGLKDHVGSMPLVTEVELQESTAHEIDGRTYRVAERDVDECAALLYTSGTTGVPKGVMLSSRNILTNVAQGLARFKTTEHERVFGVLPLFHSFAQNGCIWGPFVVGATVILVPKIDRRHILRGLQDRPTVIMGVPALYGLFCLLKTAPFPDVRYFVSGGDALPDKIRSFFALLYQRKICSGYGLTETSPLISVELEDEVTATNTVGQPCAGIQISLRNQDGTKAKVGDVGQLWVKGDNVMLGYHNAPEATAAVLQDGWLDTGDLARVDDRGRLVIEGRLKDLIIHKGLNIYPQEIENILLGHSGVTKAGVIGKKDPDHGEVPIAYVAVADATEKTVSQLHSLCRKNLAPYKCPREIIVRDDLPVTATGKVDKKVLRKELHEQTSE